MRRAARRMVLRQRGQAQAQLALAQARAGARDEAFEALGAVRRERERRAGGLRGAAVGGGGRRRGRGGREKGGDLVEARFEGLEGRAQGREEPGELTGLGGFSGVTDGGVSKVPGIAAPP